MADAVQVAVTGLPEPTTNVTPPLGATPPPLTVADSVTGWPSVPEAFVTFTVGVPAVALPLSLMICVDPATLAELSVVIIEPEMEPACCGEN